MADDPQEVRRINLVEALPFLQLFRAFRLAIHQHKLLLALVALILTYCLGRVMDLIWPHTHIMPTTAVKSVTPMPGLTFRLPTEDPESAMPASEIRAYIRYRDCEEFDAWCEAADEARDKRLGELLLQLKAKDAEEKETPEGEEALEEIGEAVEDAVENAQEDALTKVRERIEEVDEDERNVLLEAYKNVAVAVLVGPTREVSTAQAGASLQVLTEAKVTSEKKEKDDEEKEEKKDNSLCRDEESKLLRKAIAARVVAQEAASLTGKGIFATFLAHEIDTFYDALDAILRFEHGIGSRPAVGLKAAFVDLLGGVAWLFGAHWLYAVLFTVVALLIWSLFGGAICRIAALHAARDEKISFKQSIKFSGRKLFSFFSAPIIPVALLAAIGAFILLGALVGMIPYVGEIFVGLLWPLALVGGVIMVLVLIGAIAGFMLMFPTIAVEGSDSFDALSRSFSYVYAKPWRTAFYVLVSGFYGALCYLFVRLFAHLVLNVTHTTVGLLMNVDGSAMLPETVGKLDAMWTPSGLLDGSRFFGEFTQYPLNGTEAFCAFLITVWTFIVVGLVVSFTISFFFSSSTLIYYLLRREVDATDIEDVYLEEYEEELAPVTPAPTDDKPSEEESKPEGEAEAPGGEGEESGQQQEGGSEGTDQQDKPQGDESQGG